jgi:hypothetical protein
MSKGITKKNEEKLRLFLSKQNDTKPSTEKNRSDFNQSQNGKELSKGVGAGFSSRS